MQEAEVTDEGDKEDDDEDGAVWIRERLTITINTLATRAKTGKSEQNR